MRQLSRPCKWLVPAASEVCTNPWAGNTCRARERARTRARERESERASEKERESFIRNCCITGSVGSRALPAYRLWSCTTSTLCISAGGHFKRSVPYYIYYINSLYRETFQKNKTPYPWGTASPCRSLVQWHLKQINFKKFKQNYPFVAPLGKPL